MAHTENMERIYSWMKQGADPDGFLTTSAGTCGSALQIPTRTVQGCLQRLEQQGKVHLLAYRRWVVTELCD